MAGTVFSDQRAAPGASTIISNPNVFPPRVADTRPAKVFADQKHAPGQPSIPFVSSRRGDQ